MVMCDSFLELPALSPAARPRRRRVDYVRRRYSAAGARRGHLRGAFLDLGDRLGDRLAHLERDQTGVVVAPASQMRGEAAHRRRSLVE